MEDSDHKKIKFIVLDPKIMHGSAPRYKEHECYYCHVLKPANEMHEKTVEEKSGRTSMGASFNPARKNSGRIYKGRTHYRTKKIRVCEECYRKYHSFSAIIKDAFLSLLMFVLMIIFGIAILIFLAVACTSTKQEEKKIEAEQTKSQMDVSEKQTVQKEAGVPEKSSFDLVEKLKQNASETESAHFDNDEPEYLK